MKTTISATNRIAALAAAVLLASASGAWAAETACGPTPNPPDIPDDGATATSKEMEEAINGLEEYSNKFAEFNECTVNEYNEALAKWNAAQEAYQNKGK